MHDVVIETVAIISNLSFYSNPLLIDVQTFEGYRQHYNL